MQDEEILKEKRAKLLSELIEKIKLSKEKKNIKGEMSSKIFIYSRLADYTFYSEVSIRKFLTGTVPKDITSFVEGIIQYAKLVELDEEYIEEFTKEYVLASNAVVISSNKVIKTKNNLIPQDLTTIIRPKKLVEFINEFLEESINIAYIYGYKLSGKTKSVMAYMSDLINKNKYENVIWIDIKNKENQIERIIDIIVRFLILTKEQISKEEKREICINMLSTTNSIIVLDLNNTVLENDTIEFLKEITRYSKLILISSNSFKDYEEELSYYMKSFCLNNCIEKDEFEEMLKLNEQGTSIIENKAELVEKIYKLTDGFPFAAIYILKKIIEENKIGMELDEAVKKYIKYNANVYEELAIKIIEESWNELSDLAKKILMICSKFDYSVSIKLIANICNIDIADNEWKNALKECYEKDLLTPIIINNPRVCMNNMIKTLVLTYEKEKNEIFIDKIGEYYLNLVTYIGECYNDLDKLKLLDELDEWNIVIEVLKYLEQERRYKEYIKIVRELKYYIYVRGMWEIGENSIHLKRVKLAKLINDINEELEGLCDYINICSKSKNNIEAEKYLNIATKIVQENSDKIERRIMCLYNHIKALYLYNCKSEYENCYEIWKYNKENYALDVSKYRNLVNDLWITRCYIKIEKDVEKIINELNYKINEMKEEKFVRAELDYELLLIQVLFEKYQENVENTKMLEQIEQELDKCEELFKTKSHKDIRNEAKYYSYRAFIYSYKNMEDSKNKYIEKAIGNYKLMNCKDDIEWLNNIIFDIDDKRRK